MNFSRRKIYVLLLFVFYPSMVAGYNNNYGADFLKIPVSAITSGLSDAYTSMVGADSVLFNPAGMGLLTYSAFSFSHNKYLEGLNQEYLTTTINSEYGNFSAFYSSLTSGDITAYDENENIIGKTSTYHRFYGFSYSKGFPYFDYANKRIDPMIITPSWTRIKPVGVYIPKVYRLSFGFTIKKIEEGLDNEKSSTFAFDIGGLLVLPGHFQIGASYQNLGGDQKFYSQKLKLPQIFRFGISKDFATVREIMNFIFIMDYVNDSSSKDYFNIGFENDILKFFQMRVGYTTREKEGSNLSFGMGMNFDRLISKGSYIKGFRMDYAFVNYGVLGITHRIGFEIVW